MAKGNPTKLISFPEYHAIVGFIAELAKIKTKHIQKYIEEYTKNLYGLERRSENLTRKLRPQQIRQWNATEHSLTEIQSKTGSKVKDHEIPLSTMSDVPMSVNASLENAEKALHREVQK